MTDKRLHSMLLHVFESLKGMNAKCLNDMFSVKQNKYSMRQAVKLVQPRRKTTTLGLKTVLYLGAKLWNDNAVLYNELWNEDFLTFKHIIIKLLEFRYHNIWRFSVFMKTHICPTYFYLSLTTVLFYPSSSFRTCFIIELWMNLWNIFNNLSLTWPYMCVYIYICNCVYIYVCICVYVRICICIYIHNIVAYIIKIFMFSVYMYMSAGYFLFAPGSYTSHWLMFLL